MILVLFLRKETAELEVRSGDEIGVIAILVTYDDIVEKVEGLPGGLDWRYESFSEVVPSLFLSLFIFFL